MTWLNIFRLNQGSSEKMNGKGDKRRPEDNKSYRDNYDKIFKKRLNDADPLEWDLVKKGNINPDVWGKKS